jgi:hypothetical protein
MPTSLAISRTSLEGASWRDVGRVLQVAEDAETELDVVDALADQKREVWHRFWA